MSKECVRNEGEANAALKCNRIRAPAGLGPVAAHRPFRFPLQPDGLCVIDERVAGEAILDRIGEMDAGDIIIPEGIVCDQVIAGGKIVRCWRQKVKAFGVPALPVKVDSFAAVSDLIVGDNAVSAVVGNNAVIVHIADDIVPDFGIEGKTEPDGII